MGGLRQQRGIGGLAAIGTALLLTAGAPAPSRALEGFLYTRAVEVERPGLTRVPLDLEALIHMRPGGEDLHLFSPEGRQLPLLDTSALPDESRDRATVRAVERREGGWWIRIDAGGEPGPHRGLEFAFTDQALAPGVRLESSPDGSSWRLLAETDLFRLGDAPDLGRTSLVYEATSDRLLRLWWPESAGFPEVRRILVERPLARSIEQRVEGPPSPDRGPARAEYRLRIAAPRATRLSLELEGDGAVGYRLARAGAGAWTSLSEGIWNLEPGAPRTRALRLRPAGPADLRLELDGDGGAPPQLAAYTIEYPARAAVFRAPAAGTYTLAYGSERRARARGRLSQSDWETAGWVEAGPELAHPAPPLPASAVAAGAAMPDVTFDSAWRILGPAAERGAVVRLELPDEAVRASRRNLADLRLAAAGRQLPFLRWRPDPPRAVLTDYPARPVAQAERGRSRVEVELPARPPNLTQLKLTTRDGPFRRRVRARFRTGARPGLAGGERSTGWQVWTCRSASPLPCRLVVPLPALSGDRLLLELDDGDNPALAELRIDLWQRREVLAFVWPETGDETLLAGSPELGAPDYDLALAGDALRARPWREARLDLESAIETAAGRDRLGRLLLLGALVLAAILLLALLGRTLGRPGAHPD